MKSTNKADSATIYGFIIREEPTPKARPRLNRRTGAVYTPTATKKAEKRIRETFKTVCGDAPMFHGQVAVTCVFTCSRSNKSDVDNLAKTVLDALNGVCYLDDSQVAYLETVRQAAGVNGGEPSTRVTVCPLEYSDAYAAHLLREKGVEQ